MNNNTKSTTNNKTELKYVGIDSWNRPIWKDAVGNYYGSLDKLFGYTDTFQKVESEVTEKDITYFGISFDCEPMGTAVDNIEIVRSGE